MKMFWCFFKKEWQESWRTKKLWILLILFAILGIISPLLALLTPKILEMSFSETYGMTIPVPTSHDSWVQFYSNLTQLGIYLVVILFSGVINREVAAGSLIPLVTKGLKRQLIVLSKFSVMFIQWCMGILLAFAICWGYTSYYFSDQKSPHIFAGLWPLLLFGVLLLALTLCMSTMTNTNSGSLIGTVLVMIGLYLLNLFEVVQNWNPISLISVNSDLIQGTAQINNYMGALILTISGAIGFLLLALIVFQRKKL